MEFGIRNMLQYEENLKMYSLSEAAKLMGIGRDNLRALISQGLIGYILLGKSKRIPHQEIVRFQTENTIRKIEPININKNNSGFIQRNKSKIDQEKSSFESKELLDNILRSDNHGNNKRERRDMAHPVV